MANRGEISRDTVKEWESATPKGKKLPERVKKHGALGEAYNAGFDAALAHFKTAGEEIRLQIPRREYHGYDEAWREAARRGGGTKQGAEERMMEHEEAKQAPLEPQGDPNQPAEALAQRLQTLLQEPGAVNPDATKDPLDRTTLWGGATNPFGGDTASREPSFTDGLGNIGTAF